MHISRVLCSPSLYLSLNAPQVSMFPVTQYSQGSILPWPMILKSHIPKVPCSHGQHSLKPYILKSSCSYGPMFPKLYISKVLCSQSSKFQKLHVSMAHGSLKAYVLKAPCPSPWPNISLEPYIPIASCYHGQCSLKPYIFRAPFSPNLYSHASINLKPYSSMAQCSQNLEVQASIMALCFHGQMFFHTLIFL